MAETINQMRERHEKEIAYLQEYCPHTETKWMLYMWAAGHYDGFVRVCSGCEKDIEKSNDTPAGVEDDHE